MVSACCENPIHIRTQRQTNHTKNGYKTAAACQITEPVRIFTVKKKREVNDFREVEGGTLECLREIPGAPQILKQTVMTHT